MCVIAYDKRRYDAACSKRRIGSPIRRICAAAVAPSLQFPLTRLGDYAHKFTWPAIRRRFQICRRVNARLGVVSWFTIKYFVSTGDLTVRTTDGLWNSDRSRLYSMYYRLGIVQLQHAGYPNRCKRSHSDVITRQFAFRRSYIITLLPHAR